MGNSIREIHESKAGKASDKWDSYLSYYDQVFFPFKDKTISILEIGVQNGGSLETYSEYFRSAQNIIGCDVNLACGKLIFSDPRISIILGNACDAEVLKKVENLTPSLDLVVDDGSHVSRDILNSFLNFFPILKPGGIYIVEDCHTLFDKKYGGGILNQFSAQQFFKLLADVVSYEWWGEEIKLESHLANFFGSGIPRCIEDGWIDSVEFRNSIITVRKAQFAGHRKLGSRRVVGSEFLVAPEIKIFQ